MFMLMFNMLTITIIIFIVDAAPSTMTSFTIIINLDSCPLYQIDTFPINFYHKHYMPNPHGQNNYHINKISNRLFILSHEIEHTNPREISCYNQAIKCPLIKHTLK